MLDTDMGYEVAQEYMNRLHNQGIDNSFLELESDKGMDNFDNLIDDLIYYPELESLGFNIFELSGLEELVVEIMTQILGNDYEEDLRDFVNITESYDSDNPMEGFTGFFVGLAEFPILRSFHIANLGTSASAVTMSHEFTHGFTIRAAYMLNDYLGNIHYDEFPSIMMEKMFTNEFAKYSDDDIESKITTIRHDICSHSAHIMLDHIRNEDVLDEYEETIAKHMYHLGYGYIVCDTYATYLYNLYKDDPKKFLKFYRALIKGEINLKDYFKKYDVSFENDKVLDTYIKSLKTNI